MSTLWVLNPNTTASMTDAVLAQVRAQVPAGVEVRGVTASVGAPVIATRETFDAATQAVPAMADQCHEPAEGTDGTQGGGLLLACFGDPGLEALRRRAAPRPVAGLAEASVAAAVAAGRRFAILTAGPAWVGLLTQRVTDFGADAWLTGVLALPVDGRALAAEPSRYRDALADAARQAERGGAQALILGGAAFAGLARLVDTPLPVIDAIDAATAALLARLA